MIRNVLSFIGWPGHRLFLAIGLLTLGLLAAPSYRALAQVAEAPGSGLNPEAQASGGQIPTLTSSPSFESGGPGTLVELPMPSSDAALAEPLTDTQTPGRAPEEAFPGRHGPAVRVRLESETGVRDLVAQLIDGTLVAEGDMILGRVGEAGTFLDVATDPDAVAGDPDRAGGGAEDRSGPPGTTAVVRRSSAYYWPNGVVPYTIDGSLSWQMVNNIQRAIQHWNAYTPVRLVPRRAQQDYVRFAAELEGCFSDIGRIGGEQTINLGPGCDASSAAHEIGHAVGFFHEQSRNDRDAYIVVWWNNIEPDMAFNFYKAESAGIDVGAFDFSSIMLYDSYAFSWNGQPTMTLWDGRTFSAQRQGLSAGDIAAAWAMYGGSTATSIGAIRADRGCGSSYRSGEEVPVYLTVNQAGYYNVAIASSAGRQSLASMAYLVPGTVYEVVSESGTPYRAGSPGWRELELQLAGSYQSVTCAFTITR